MKRALLIVDHGSRNPDARAATAALTRTIAAQRPEWLVDYAHMELAQPDFDTGVDALVARGARKIYLHLHFLSAGFHVRETIPELIEKALVRHPSLEFETSAPLGEDPRIPDLILARLDASLR